MRSYGIYTMEYYATERKKELLPFVTAWMGLESVMINEISQVIKDKYLMIFKYFTALSSCFHEFCWEIYCNSYPIPF